MFLKRVNIALLYSHEISALRMKKIKQVSACKLAMITMVNLHLKKKIISVLLQIFHYSIKKVI